MLSTHIQGGPEKNGTTCSIAITCLNVNGFSFFFTIILYEICRQFSSLLIGERILKIG